MNPWLQLLFIGLAVFAVIFILALACAVFVLSAGKRYSQKLFQVLKEEILELMPKKECPDCPGCQELVEKMLDGEVEPGVCSQLTEENAEKIKKILEEYRAEQERIRKAAEENRKNRPNRRRVLKFLSEKKDKGEWL